MKHPLVGMAIGIVLLASGFVAGQYFQHARTGYYYHVDREKTYVSELGDVHWSYVHESIGLPFLDPGSTVIKLGDRTIYEAKCGLQEPGPFADNIKTSGKSISWDDRELRFHLTVEPVKKEAKKIAPSVQP